MKYIVYISLAFLLSCSDKSGTPEATIIVPQGEIKLRFFSDIAPKHVENFISLVEDGFYDGTTFHRVERGYLVQGGDPKSKKTPIYDDGTGTMSYTIPSESHFRHFRGAVAMAKKPSSINPENRSNGCQFYIALDSLPQLDPEKYTIFAFVVSGFETLDKMGELEPFHDMNPNNNWEKKTEMEVRISYLTEQTKKGE